MILQANTPLNNAEINPMIYDNSNKIKLDVSEISENPLIDFIIRIPKIGTRTIRKENLVAFSLSIFKSKAIDIVEPDLEIPGSIARA